MCGIAGVFDPKIDEKGKVIGDMVSTIFHRGPDEDGFFYDKNVGLGMRRLSIIDLSTGKQPISSADGKILIFFNGEIYNYKELRDELVGQGIEFKTNSDTETILHMYELHGEKMLPRLRGMFAFCIYNIETRNIFLARDFFGIKPLYYLVNQDSAEERLPQGRIGRIVAFSSEIKSFQKIPGFLSEVNDEAVINYLSFQYNPLPETFFKNVYKLPPAHFLKIDLISGKSELKKYWSFAFAQDETLDEKEMSRIVLDTVRDSVEHHMIADVPVGAFLSGGVDSSIITTLMVQLRSPQVQEIRGKNSSTPLRAGKIKTFTVGFETLTEAKEAKETSDSLGTDHTEIIVNSEEYFSALSKAVYHFDEPVADPSAIGLYFLAREARKQVKVVLSGEGADELFGGYNIYLEPFARKKLLWVPQVILKMILAIPFGFFGKNYLKRVSQKLSEWYIGNASIFKQDEINLLLKDGDKKLISLDEMWQKTKNLSQSTQMQYIDINTWLVGDILAKADKMTMAHSLELRVPFLDKEVAKLAQVLPDKFKWRNGVTKYLLREAFKKTIPESTRNRKKLGFPTPVRDWFTKDREEVYNTILESPYIKNRMNSDYIQNIIDDHITKRVDNSRKIYTLLMLALWYNVFIKS